MDIAGSRMGQSLYSISTLIEGTLTRLRMYTPMEVAKFQKIANAAIQGLVLPGT